MARPPKKPDALMNTDLRIPVTAAQKDAIREAVELLGVDMATWARPILAEAAEAVLAKKTKGKSRN